MIKVKNITKKYFGHATVIQDLSISIQSNEKICIYGENGDGKSTLAKIIAGIEYVDSGEVLYNDKPLKEIKPKERKISMVFDYLYLPGLKTIKSTLKRPLRLMGLKRKAIKEKLFEVQTKYEIFNLMDNINMLLNPYCRVKVALIRATLKNPDYMIIDNPLIHLEINERKEFYRELIPHFDSYKGTLIYFTNSIYEAEKFNGKVGILKNGKLVQFDYFDKIKEKPKNISVCKALNKDINLINAKIKTVNKTSKILIKDTELTLPKCYNSDCDILIPLDESKCILNDKGVFSYKPLKIGNKSIVESDLCKDVIFATGNGDKLDLIIDNNTLIYNKNTEELIYGEAND